MPLCGRWLGGGMVDQLLSSDVASMLGVAPLAGDEGEADGHNPQIPVVTSRHPHHSLAGKEGGGERRSGRVQRDGPSGLQ